MNRIDPDYRDERDIANLAYGGMYGRAVNTSNAGSRGSGVKPRLSRSSLDNKRYSTLLFTSPRCINGYRRHTA